jgi:hypothetical protein
MNLGVFLAMMPLELNRGHLYWFEVIEATEGGRRRVRVGSEGLSEVGAGPLLCPARRGNIQVMG